MNQRLVMLGCFGLGIMGAAVSVSGYFTLPGQGGWKLLGSAVGCGGFTASMCIARALTALEPQKQRIRTIWDENNLEKARIMADVDLQAFTQQAMVQAAEVAYAVLEPYQQPLLEGDSLDDITTPSDKLTGSEVDAEGNQHPMTAKESKLSTSEHGCQLFDWRRFKTHPDDFPHIRIIGQTGKGKTLLADWLLDVLGGDRFVITIKRKLRNWRGLTVYGLTRDYEACRRRLLWVLSEMDRRFDLLEKDIEPEMVNFVVDEWRSISQNVKPLKDPGTGEIVSPSAKEMMKEIITLARDARLRLIALAQGKQVKTWGLEDESDLEECFTTIRLGQFAVEYARSLRNTCKKDSVEYQHWTAVLNELADQGDRCCLVADVPARVPDLSNWQREGGESIHWVEQTRSQLEEYWQMEGVETDEDLDDKSDDEDDIQPDFPQPSIQATKLIAWMRRRTLKTGQEWFSVRDVQRSEPIKGAKASDLLALFDEIVQAGIGQLNGQGDIGLF